MLRIGHLAWITGAVLAVGFGAAQLAGRSARGGAACEDLGVAERRECYRRALSARLTAGGVPAAVAALDSFAAANPWVAEHAHEYAHGVGIEAYRAGRPTDITAMFAACGDGYSSGCRHGVIQAYFEAEDSVGRAEVESLCRPFKPPAPAASRWVLFQCVHGMGHGLTMLYGHDLPRALADCDLLADGWDRESCYGGAFMENVINATAPHHPATQLAAQSHHHTAFQAIDPNDPLYPCSIMDSRYLHACYQMQTSVMLHLNGGDIAGAARSCDRAPVSMRPVCYQSLGRDITSYALRDPAKTAELCDQGSESYRPACYTGAAKALVDWTATTDAALEFCRIVVGDEPHGLGAGACYRALGEEIATLLAAAPERARQCARAEHPVAVAACRAGAGI
ncbi:MAG: hypothetical protein ACREMN_11390 [Gemmatimonadales bacterium]